MRLRTAGVYGAAASTAGEVVIGLQLHGQLVRDDIRPGGRKADRRARLP